ncbi:MAG TPA: hypothetical protein VHN14_27320 [Kofleriaceae bacterium]|nr:hypothetical protein [Kofleriaceae bacterium]
MLSPPLVISQELREAVAEYVAQGTVVASNIEIAAVPGRMLEPARRPGRIFAAAVFASPSSTENTRRSEPSLFVRATGDSFETVHAIGASG